MGKSTISMAIFNSKLLVYQRVPGIYHIAARLDQVFSIDLICLGSTAVEFMENYSGFMMLN